jgi:glycosyltransferase involved in cell wall biosynthesis
MTAGQTKALPASDALAGARVLVAAEHLTPNGGTGAHAMAAVACLRARGVEVEVVVGDEPGEAASFADHVIPGLGAKPTSADTRSRLAELLDRARPDLVHVQQLPDGELVPLIEARSPVVFNVHNHVTCTSGWKYFRRAGEECDRAHGPGCLANLAARGCAHSIDPRALPGRYRRTSAMVRGLREASVVVAHSRFVLEQLRGNGVDRTATVPLFVEPPAVAPTEPPGDGPVLFSGRVTPAKGIEVFLRAVARSGARAEVCGDGWGARRARRLAARLGIAERVSFRGWLSREHLSDAYRRSRLVVVPSVWPEPFGLVGIEAMAHGRPVIGTATGGIPEWLVDDETGLLVPPGDAAALAGAIEALLENPRRAALLGARGADRVAIEFSRDRYLEGIGNAYRSAIRRWHRS